MLKSLSISNVALIEQLDIDFCQGLTALSGETGSGKSIIIDSLSFVLGERADKSLIRYGADTAEVTALFELEQDDVATARLQEYGYDVSDGQLLVSRKMSNAGKNEVRIQGKPSTLSILRSVAAELVDIFGQGEHLALLDERKQLAVLDEFCQIDTQSIDQQKRLVAQTDRQIAELGGNADERARTLDFLRYQIEEISAANLDVAEEEQLVALRKRMMNAEKIAAGMSAVVDAVGGEGGASSALSLACDALRSVLNIEPVAEELANRLSAVTVELSDIADCAENQLSQMDFSESDADKVEDRLELIKSLKRKYGGSVQAVLQFCQDAQQQYDKISNAADLLEQLSKQRTEQIQELYKLCMQRRKLRQQVAEKLAKDIMKELADLGMKNTAFVVNFDYQPSVEQFDKLPSESTFDKVQFLMSANVGEPLKPLNKVISGGEMSRFMLAVKNITARAERIPTMVFDEIDTGISGKMAQMVANKLANAANGAQGYQCIVITHLPQIVAMADTNLVISKSVADQKTHTSLIKVHGDDRIDEVVRLMGASGQSAFDAAKQLVDECSLYKSKLN